MADISQLKKNRKSYQELAEKAQGKSQQQSQEDTRFWFPERDEDGAASTRIRLLPEPQGEDMPWVKVFKHGFQDPNTGKWYIENCPTTIGKECPVCKSNSEHWKQGENGQNIARARKRQLTHFSNILVLSDPANPDNEGTVRLFKYGKQIFDIIQAAITPQFEDETPIQPFDPWEGADFKFRIIKNQNNQTNYQKSAFGEPSELGTDEEIEEIWKKEHSLEQFVSEDNFKSYEELEKRFLQTIGEWVEDSRPAASGPSEKTEEAPSINPSENEVSSSKGSVEDVDIPSDDGDDDDDDIMNQIRQMANED